jgi:hypothetical protein
MLVVFAFAVEPCGDFIADTNCANSVCRVRVIWVSPDVTTIGFKYYAVKHNLGQVLGCTFINVAVQYSRHCVEQVTTTGFGLEYILHSCRCPHSEDLGTTYSELAIADTFGLADRVGLIDEPIDDRAGNTLHVIYV